MQNVLYIEDLVCLLWATVGTSRTLRQRRPAQCVGVKGSFYEFMAFWLKCDRNRYFGCVLFPLFTFPFNFPFHLFINPYFSRFAVSPIYIYKHIYFCIFFLHFLAFLLDLAIDYYTLFCTTNHYTLFDLTQLDCCWYRLVQTHWLNHRRDQLGASGLTRIVHVAYQRHMVDLVLLSLLACGYHCCLVHLCSIIITVRQLH